MTTPASKMLWSEKFGDVLGFTVRGFQLDHASVPGIDLYDDDGMELTATLHAAHARQLAGLLLAAAAAAEARMRRKR